MLLSWRSTQGRHVWDQLLHSRGQLAYANGAALLHTWAFSFMGHCIILYACLCAWLLQLHGYLWLEFVSEVWTLLLEWVWMGSTQVKTLTLPNVRETHRTPVSPQKMSQYRVASSNAQWSFVMLVVLQFVLSSKSWMSLLLEFITCLNPFKSDKE